MTSQSLITNPSARVSSVSVPVSSFETATSCPLDSHQSRLLQAMKSQYRLDQQTKFLHLQAEMESLLQQLKAIKQQREACTEEMVGCGAGDRRNN
ncbi:MAG: hypothetical protein WCA35_04080 [Kovacikia sp.]